MKDFVESERKKNLKEEFRKLHLSILSNIALSYNKKKNFLESTKYDKRIIDEIDPLFDKSYIRIIKSYQELGNMYLAQQYYARVINPFYKSCKYLRQIFLRVNMKLL